MDRAPRYVLQAPRSFLLRALQQLAGLAPAATLPSSDPVTASAQRCAAARALDTMRGPDALAPDPLARVLAGAQFSAYARAAARRRVLPRIAIRTRYFDAFAATRLDGAPRAQLVLLGAGMDTRAFRLEALTRNHIVFEVDAPAVLNVKEHLLRAAHPRPVLRCALRRVRADLARPDWTIALRNAGFDPGRPTIWLLEGLLYYFTPYRVAQMLREVRLLSAPGSWLCLSAVTRLRDGREGLSSKFISAMPDPMAAVADAGFSFYCTDVLGGPNANFGRWPVARPQESCAKGGGMPAAKGATIYVKAFVPGKK